MLCYPFNQPELLFKSLSLRMHSMNTPKFLLGGGEMGARIREYDWATTPVGTPDTWPQSLRTTVATILSSKFPMFLWWGNDLIQFYNDAYRPSMGNDGKHPLALGQRGRDCWPEIWPTIGPLIDQVMAGGESTWSENQLIPIYRNGKLEDVYWTFCYSPVLTESDQVGGVLVVCQETTAAVAHRQQLEMSELRFRSIFEQAPMAIGLLKGRDMIIDVGNDKIFELWGKEKSIVGMSLMEALPEIKGQGFDQLLFKVYDTGKPFFGNGMLATLNRNGALEDAYFDFAYTPLFDRSGTIEGIMVLATEVTKQVNALKELAASESKFRSLIEHAPVATSLFVGKDMVVEVANETMLGYWGKDISVIGQPLREALPELVGQPFLEILDNIFETGNSYSSQNASAELEVNGVLGTYYFSFTYKPLFNSSGEVYAIIDMAIDITAQVLAQKALEESETKLRSVINAAPAAMALFMGRELIVEMPNQAFVDIVGKGPNIVGKALREVMPELESQQFLGILDEVYTTGKMYQSFGTQVDIVQHGVMTHNYYNISYTPIFDSTEKVYAILDIAIDVTGQVESKRQVEESQMQLLALFEQSPVAIAILSKEGLKFTMANPFYGELVGRKPDQIIGKSFLDVFPELTGQGFDHILNEVIATGVPFVAKERPVDLMQDGNLRTIYVDLTYQPKKENNGDISGVLMVATEITQQVLNRQKIEEAESTLRGAIELADLGTFEIDLQTGIVHYSERFRKWMGFGLDKVIDIEKSDNPIVEWDRLLVWEALKHASQFDKDGLYDVEFSVDSSQTGIERILHAQGKVYFNDKGEAYKINGTVRDITDQRRMQQALEQQVNQRTEELERANQDLALSNEELAAMNEEFMVINNELKRSNELLARSNENLQQFAYVASHDLQEPLRKVQSFGDLLMKRYATELGDGEEYVRRMQGAATRMSALIDDLLTFSRVSAKQGISETVSLNKVINAVISVLELTVQETGSEIVVEALPSINADESQLEQLFQNLLSNALKFRHTERTCKIRVTSTVVASEDLPVLVRPARQSSAYHRIDVIDNGIGFDEKYAKRIFQVFQRLHGKTEYAGTGIGLAICEKVVVNHGGAIIATSQLREGSTFSVFLPA